MDPPLRRQSALAGAILVVTLVGTALGGGRWAAAAGLLVLAAVGACIVWPAIRASEQALAAARVAQALLVEQREDLWAQHQLVVAQAEALEAKEGLLLDHQEQLAQAAQELEAQNLTLLDQRDRLGAQAEALACSEEFAGSVIDSVPDGIVAFDAARRFTAWNATMARLYGRTAAEVMGRRLDEIFPELVAAGLGTAWDAALAGETCTRSDRAVRHAHTEATVLVDATYGPLRTRDGTMVIGGIGVLHDVTEARRQAAELERLSTVVRQTDAGVVMTDPRGRLTWVNAAWERMTGWTLADVAGRTPGAVLRGADTDPAVALAMRTAFRAGEGYTGEVLNYRRDGQPFWSSVQATPVRDGEGRLIGWVGIKRDVTARRLAERERHQLGAAVDLMPDGVSLSAPDGTFEYVNAAQAALFGYDAPEAMRGVDWRTLHVPEHVPALVAELDLALARDGHWSGEALGRRRDGSTFPLEFSVRRLPLGGAVAVSRDVTVRKQHEELLRTWSLRDALTGLHNRRGFGAAAEEALRAAGTTGAPALLLYGDLNDFKAINDTLGHDAGDEALVDAAAVLREVLGPAALLARLGGDEFTALLVDADVDAAGPLVRRLAQALAARNARPTSPAPLSLSLGAVAWVPSALAGTGADAPGPLLRRLLQAADGALYAAKARKRAAGQRAHVPLWFELAAGAPPAAPPAAPRVPVGRPMSRCG